MKSNHQCRRCGRWLEGEWNRAAKLSIERAELQRQMDQGHCDVCPRKDRPMTTPSPALQAVALQAVATVAAEHPGETGFIYATKIVYDQEGCGLLAARDAVRWALDHPGAASLPAGSVVGSAHAAWFKEAHPGQPHSRWVSTWSQWHTDADIDSMLHSGEATILRVGTGS